MFYFLYCHKDPRNQEFKKNCIFYGFSHKKNYKNSPTYQILLKSVHSFLTPHMHLHVLCLTEHKPCSLIFQKKWWPKLYFLHFPRGFCFFITLCYKIDASSKCSHRWYLQASLLKVFSIISVIWRTLKFLSRVNHKHLSFFTLKSKGTRK